MNIFTVTELKQSMSDVFNAVQGSGLACIKNRTRPTMILIDKKYLDEALINDKTKAVLMADLTL